MTFVEMTMADAIRDRKDAEEARYKLNEEQGFKIRARRSKLFGLWAADQIGLRGDQANTYAVALVGTALDLPNDDRLIAYVVEALSSRGIDTDETRVRRALGEAQEEARRQILAAHPKALDTDHRRVGD